jgi:hypothetical protein
LPQTFYLRADSLGMPDSRSDAAATPIPRHEGAANGGKESAAFDVSQARFFAEHQSLAGRFPHHNLRNQAILRSLNVSCESCEAPLPLQRLHGVINDYPNCTEVRYVGHCPCCDGVVQNVLRVTVGQMTYLRDGEWCTTVRRPWWHCLWPWPIDSDREW